MNKNETPNIPTAETTHTFPDKGKGMTAAEAGSLINTLTK